MVALALLGLSGLFNLARDVGQPFGGYLAGRNIKYPRWFVDNVTPPHWPALLVSGLKRDSLLISLDGRPYGFDDRTVFAEAWAQGRREIALTYSASGVDRTIQLSVQLFTWQQYIDSTLPELILAASFWLLAIALYRSRPDDPVNRTTAVFFVTLGAFRLMAWPSLFRDGDGVARLLEFIFVGMLWPLFSALWAHFALIFPTTSRFLKPLALIVIYVNAALICVGYALVRYAWWTNGWSPQVGELDEVMWRWLVYTFVAAVAVLVGRLVWITFSMRTSFRNRRQAGVFLLGMVITMIPIGIWISSAFGPSASGFFLGQLDVRYLFLGAPLMLAFVILRYRTFRSMHPLFRAVAALASSALLASIAAWIWWTALPLDVQTTVAPPFEAFLLMLLTVIGLWALQSVLGDVLTHAFNRDRIRIDQSRAFGLALADLPASIDAPLRLAETLTRILRVERAALWRLTSGAGLTLTSLAGTWRLPPPAAVSRSLAIGSEPMHLQRPNQTLEGESLDLAAAGLELLLPLKTSEGPIGLLAIGPRPDEEIFDDRDVDALQLIAQQTALFLLSAEQLEEVHHMSQALDQAQEVERLRIAHELHDTTQQSLNGLAFSLTLIRRRLLQDPAQMEALINESIAETQTAIQTLYQIRYNLDMSELDRGLNQPVRNMLERFGKRWNWTVAYEAADEVDQDLNGPGRAAVFRLIHQALENVAAHARATTVQVKLAAVDERVTFEVRDDGVGSSSEERQRASNAGHLGLRTMRTRVESLGGEFRFDSELGQGTRVSGWLPVSLSVPP